MTETIKLPGEWGLRKLALANETQWALQYMGMDWMQIYVCDFLPTNGEILDEEIRKFAAAMNAPHEQLADLRAEIGRLRAALKLAREQVDANVHGRTAALMAIDGALNGGDAWASHEHKESSDGS